MLATQTVMAAASAPMLEGGPAGAMHQRAVPCHPSEARAFRRRRSAESLCRSGSTSPASPASDLDDRLFADDTFLRDGGSPPKKPKTSLTAYPTSSNSNSHNSPLHHAHAHYDHSDTAAAMAIAMRMAPSAQRQRQAGMPLGGALLRPSAAPASSVRGPSPPTAALRRNLVLSARSRKELLPRKDSGVTDLSGSSTSASRTNSASSSSSSLADVAAAVTASESNSMVITSTSTMTTSTRTLSATAPSGELRRRLSRAAGLTVPTPVESVFDTSALTDASDVAAAHAMLASPAPSPPSTPPSPPRPQRFGLPAPEETALARVLDYVSPDALATLLQWQPESVLVLDCRAALAFAHTRLPGAVHVQFSALMLRRFKRRARCAITVADLKTTDSVRLGRRHDARARVVVYDDDTVEARPDSPVGVLVRILRDEGVEPICLRGGMAAFRARHAHLLEAPQPAHTATPPRSTTTATTTAAPAAPVAAVTQHATDMHSAPAVASAVPATTVFDFLMLSNSAQGCDVAFLRHHGITHVVNITQRPFAPDVVAVAKCMQIPLQNGPGHDLLSILPQALRVIDTARMEGGRALLYCSDGLSRATAITLAYMISTRQFSLRSAFATLLRLRPEINPHEAFVEQLGQYEVIVRRAALAKEAMTSNSNVAPAALTQRRARLNSRV